MNQKKCPKCGEMNPPEAVMCWACYTPLTGAAAGVAGVAAASMAGVAGMPGTAPAGARPGSAVGPPVEEGEKEKPKITPAQMGILAVALLLAIGFGAKTMFGGSSEVVPTDDLTGTAAQGPPPDAQAPAPVVAQGAPPPPGGGGGAEVSVPPETAKLPFSVVVSPNPASKAGTMAILATNPATSSAEAVNLARMTRQRMGDLNRWQPLHIYVLTNQADAQTLLQRQIQSKGQPLRNADYQGLAAMWPRVPVCYQYTGRREVILYPSRNPGSWWTARR